MKIRLVLIFIIIGSKYSFSQVRNQAHAEELYNKATAYIQQGITYLKSSQQKENDSIYKLKGEWESQMSMNFWFPLLGREKSAYDSNCFSVATIHNILAKIYLNHPEYKEIPPILDMAFDRIMGYQSNGTFNFWNLLPPTKPHKWFEKGTNEVVRRPNNFPLKIKFMLKAANVTNDADDTAAGFLAIYLQNKIYNNPTPDSLVTLYEIFDNFTDKDRNNRLWYNFWQKQGPESGAYLTWLDNEFEFSSNWNPVKELIHLSTFYLPFSKMFPHAYQPYIPYGSNDLDVVVNANVLNVLSIYGNHESNAFEEAIKFIEYQLEEKNYNYGATYYPNQYHIPYYVSKAYKNGVDGLSRSCDLIEEFILEEYKLEEKWTSRDIINKGDRLQSTVLAVNSMLNISGIKNKKSEEAIVSGVEYIFSNANESDQEVYWDGGVFFSGGTLVRHVLHWKSDPVTTAMVLEALVEFKIQLETKYPSLKDFN